MAEKLNAVKGMNDILPPAVPRTEKLPILSSGSGSSPRCVWFWPAMATSTC
jgi:hypothetical protein